MGLFGLFDSFIERRVIGLSGADGFEYMSGFVLGVFGRDHCLVKFNPGFRPQRDRFIFGCLNKFT